MFKLLNKDIFSVIITQLNKENKLNFALTSKSIYSFFINDNQVVLNSKICPLSGNNICHVIKKLDEINNICFNTKILIVDYHGDSNYYINEKFSFPNQINSVVLNFKSIIIKNDLISKIFNLENNFHQLKFDIWTKHIIAKNIFLDDNNNPENKNSIKYLLSFCKEIKFAENFNHKIKFLCSYLSKDLEKIVFNDNFNQFIGNELNHYFLNNDIGYLPINLKEIIFGHDFKKDLYKTHPYKKIIPDSVQILIFGHNFNFWS